MSNFDNENYAVFLELFERIKEKHRDKLKEVINLDEAVKSGRIFYMRMIISFAVICVVLIIVVIWNNIFGIKDSNFLKFFLLFSICFLSILYLKRLLEIDERLSTMSVQHNLAYKYYCENIMPDIVRNISLSIEQNSDEVDVAFSEMKDYFLHTDSKKIFRAFELGEFVSFPSDFVLSNHYYSEKNGIRIDMFEMYRDVLHIYYHDYDIHLGRIGGFSGWIYSSSQMGQSLKGTIDFYTNEIKKIRDFDEGLSIIIEEFSKYEMTCRVIIHENRLMLLMKIVDFPFDSNPFLIDKRILNKNFLYYQYKGIDFMTNLSLRLNQYCSSAHNSNWDNS